jgi:hypothetical protein
MEYLVGKMLLPNILIKPASFDDRKKCPQRQIFPFVGGVAAHFRLTETQLFFAGSADREKTFAGRIDR